MQPIDGIHHITLITGDAPAQRRLLRAGARTADGQEDRQPGRPGRLPPVLCRRARLAGRRHHVLRVPGRGPRHGRRRHGRGDPAPRRRRRRARLLGAAARRRGRRDRAARRRGLAVRRPRGHGPRARDLIRPGRAADRRPPRGPGAVSPSRGSRRSAPRSRTRRAARRCCSTCSASPSSARTTGRRGATPAAAGSCSSSQTIAASPAPAPSTTSPGPCVRPSSPTGVSRWPPPAPVRRR